MSLGFENLFEKYNISCEAPAKRRKCSKSDKSKQNKSNFRHDEKEQNKEKKKAIDLSGISTNSESKTVVQGILGQRNASSLLDVNKHNLSPSSPDDAMDNMDNQSNRKDEKMWDLMKSTRQSLMRFKPLNKVVNRKENSTVKKWLSKTSSMKEEGINLSMANISNEESQEGNMSEEWHTSSLTPHSDQTNLIDPNSSICSKENTSNGERTKSQCLSLNRHYQEKRNRTIVEKSNSFNIKKKKQNQRNQSRFKPLDITTTQKSIFSLNVTTIDKQKPAKISRKENLPTSSQSNYNLDISFSSSLSEGEEDESFHPFISSSPKASQIIDTPTTSSQKSTDKPTELDLLLELIEHDGQKRAPVTKPNPRDIPSPKKSCLKGGYEEQFLRALDRLKISGRYLKHDKKFGFKTGVQLKVLKLETSYGVNVATVECLEDNNIFCIVIALEMFPKIELGTIIEAFFDDKSVPYKLETKDGSMDLFLEPYKLLVVEKS